MTYVALWIAVMVVGLAYQVRLYRRARYAGTAPASRLIAHGHRRAAIVRGVVFVIWLGLGVYDAVALAAGMIPRGVGSTLLPLALIVGAIGFVSNSRFDLRVRDRVRTEIDYELSLIPGAANTPDSIRRELAQLDRRRELLRHELAQLTGAYE